MTTQSRLPWNMVQTRSTKQKVRQMSFFESELREQDDQRLHAFCEDFEHHCEDEGCDLEALMRDEEFVSAALEAAYAVVRTHDPERRSALLNKLLKVAKSRQPDASKPQSTPHVKAPQTNYVGEFIAPHKK